MLTLALHVSRVRPLGALPAIVAIHAVVAADDRADTADADAWLAGLRAADRFLEDIWGSGTG